MIDPGEWSLTILPTIDADGPTQMGLDLALLDHAHDESGTIWFRTYTWSRPTLSLGYFQAWHDASESIRDLWKGFDVVRRPSGGGAIVHHGDLTYAIVVPSTHPWCGQARTLYQAMHDAVSKLLTEDGADATRRQLAHGFRPIVSAATYKDTKPPSPFLCFEDGDADDVVLDGVKIVGGAQRRRVWATMQHGSIRWRSPGQGPGAAQPGLIDLRPGFRETSHVRWAADMGERLGRAWNLQTRRTNYPAEVMLAAHAWSKRLREPEWMDKR
jgi:lipoate-protein ligase A